MVTNLDNYYGMPLLFAKTAKFDVNGKKKNLNQMTCLKLYKIAIDNRKKRLR